MGQFNIYNSKIYRIVQFATTGFGGATNMPLLRPFVLKAPLVPIHGDQLTQYHLC